MAVLGASGGVGTSVFAAALACAGNPFYILIVKPQVSGAAGWSGTLKSAAIAGMMREGAK